MRAIALLMIAVLMAACAGPIGPERLSCLGEGAEARCGAIFRKDLGLPEATGSAASVRRTGGVPLGTSSLRRNRTAGQSNACLVAGQSFPVGTSTRREVRGDARGIGMVRPRPGDGRARGERCTCLSTAGGGTRLSCRPEAG